MCWCLRSRVYVCVNLKREACGGDGDCQKKQTGLRTLCDKFFAGRKFCDPVEFLYFAGI